MVAHFERFLLHFDLIKNDIKSVGIKNRKRLTGVEPVSFGSKPKILPLNYNPTKIKIHDVGIEPTHSDYKSNITTVRPVVPFMEILRIELRSLACKAKILPIKLYPQNS